MWLDGFTAPGSVAVIGASTNPDKVGHAILRNLLSYGYPGQVYPINPHAKEILGRKCYRKVLEVPGDIDLAVVAVPNVVVPKVLLESGKKGVKAVIIVSAGFREVGGEGAKLEREIVGIAKKYRMRILGPNCLGLINTANGLNASFAPSMPPKGDIAFMSQSGALCSAVLDWAAGEGVGFSQFVSLGNEADVDETAFLRAWEKDGHSKVITGYLEGVKDGLGFRLAAKAAARAKPVIIIKGGGSSAGAKAASSHTGSLAGSEQVFRAVAKQSGLTLAGTLEELFDYAMGFAYQPLPKGPAVAIITNAGGPGVLAADACERYGLQVASLSKETVDLLRERLPATVSFYNPVDLIGDAQADRYKAGLGVIVEAAEVDSVIVILTPQALTEVEETVKVIVEAVSNSAKPVVTCFMGEELVNPGIKMLKEHQIPNYPVPERAAQVLGAMVRYAEWLRRPAVGVRKFEVDDKRVGEILKEVAASGRVNLSDWEACEVLLAYGFRVPVSKLAADAEQAVEFAEEIGYPVVMKIASPDILHKSDIGVVRLDIEDAEEVRDMFELIMLRAHKFMPEAYILGVTVQEMVPRGKEVILGMSQDPQFGSVIMFGLGGIYVEVLGDVSFRLAPLDEREAREMIEEVRSYPLLGGVRGERPADVEAIVENLLRLSQLVCRFPNILELDINPLKVGERGRGAIVVDARMTIRGGG